MAYPAGVILRPVTFGPAFELEDGGDAGMTVAIKATRAGMLWRATGQPGISNTITASASDGLQQTLMLPVTDQVGWGDGDGNALIPGDDGHVFLYTVSVKYTQDGRDLPGGPRSKNVPIPTGDLSPLDLDDLISLTTPGGSSVAIPDIWSELIEQAQAAAVAAEAAVIDSDTFVAGRITDPASDTATALSAKIETGIAAKQDKSTLKADVGTKIAETGAARDAVDARIPAVGDARFGRPAYVESLAAPAPITTAAPWDISRQLFGYRPWMLRRTRAAIAAARAQKADAQILCVGDSNTFGLGAYLETPADVKGRAWPERLRDALGLRGIPVSEGAFFIAPPEEGASVSRDSRLVRAGNTGIVNGLLASAADTASFTYTPASQCRFFEVTYLNQWSGNFGVSVDGAAAVSVTRSAAGGYNRYTSPTVTLGAHNVKLTATGSDLHVAYVEGRLTTKALRIHKAGVSGSKASEWASTTGFDMLTNALTLYPTLVIISLGSNDTDTPANYATSIQTIVTRCRAIGAEVLVVGPPARLERDFSDYYAVLYPLAASMTFPLLDLRERVGPYTDAKALGIFTSVSGDTVHFSEQGLWDVAAAVDGALALT